jgi:hypothetical protein
MSGPQSTSTPQSVLDAILRGETADLGNTPYTSQSNSTFPSPISTNDVLDDPDEIPMDIGGDFDFTVPIAIKSAGELSGRIEAFLERHQTDHEVFNNSDSENEFHERSDSEDEAGPSTLRMCRIICEWTKLTDS